MTTTSSRSRAHLTSEFQRAAARARWDKATDSQIADQLTAQAEGLLRRVAELRATEHAATEEP